MAGTSQKVACYRFGPFELDPGEATLSRNGMRVRLQDLPYRLLLMLVERAGEIVTREELRQHLWPENTFVEFDNSLGVAIRKVRESLNDNADAPQYVATLPRRGYRFLAPVTVQTRHESPKLPVEELGPPPDIPLSRPTGPTETRHSSAQHLLGGSRSGTAAADGRRFLSIPFQAALCRRIAQACGPGSRPGTITPLGSGARIPQFARPS